MLKPVLVSLVCSLSLMSVGVSAVADSSSEELTSQDQGSSPADVEITRQIRQNVVAQESLSTGAKNVKIITVNGLVTLKGAVKSETEKNAIQKIAVRAAGRKQVVNEISIEQ